MASQSDEFTLRVRRKFQERLLKDVGTEENTLLEPMGYHGPPQSPYSLSNFLWLLAAGTTFYFTDFPVTLFYDPRTKRVWLNVGLVLVSLTVVICLFLVVWLTHIRKVATDNWEKMYPAAIPVATASFVFGGFFMMVGLWPIWGFLTPIILFTLFMGVVVVIALLPSWV